MKKLAMVGMFLVALTFCGCKGSGGATALRVILEGGQKGCSYLTKICKYKDVVCKHLDSAKTTKDATK